MGNDARGLPGNRLSDQALTALAVEAAGSKVKLARWLGMQNQTQVTLWENGSRKVPAAARAALEVATGVRPRLIAPERDLPSKGSRGGGQDIVEGTAEEMHEYALVQQGVLDLFYRMKRKEPGAEAAWNAIKHLVVERKETEALTSGGRTRRKAAQ